MFVKLVQVLLIVSPEKSGGMYMSSVTGTETGGEGSVGSTWKLYVARSLPGPHGNGPTQAVAVTVYVPGRAFARENENEVIVPPTIEQLIGVPIRLPDSEQTVSVIGNPEPVTETDTGDVGGGMIEGLNLIC